MSAMQMARQSEKESVVELQQLRLENSVLCVMPIAANDVALLCCATCRSHSLQQHPSGTPPALVFRLLWLLLLFHLLALSAVHRGGVCGNNYNHVC